MQNQFQAPAPTVETTISIAPPAETTEPETAQTPPNAQAVTDLLAQTHSKMHCRNRRFWGTLRALFVTVTTSVFMPFIMGFFALDAHIATCTFALIIVMVLLMIVLGWERLRPVGTDPIKLMQMGGKRAIPTLLAIWRSGNGRVDQEECYSALADLLPQLHANEAWLITSDDRYWLNATLSNHITPNNWNEWHIAFAFAILKAYEQVGDAKAVPVVERLAKMKTHNQHQQELKQAAQECLPLLRARVGGLEPEQTLLRASTSNTVTPDTLLRAVTPATNTPESELLRAADGKEASSD